MSTRSGKRIHNASNENIEPELAIKSERKTRSKRLVENRDNQGVKTSKKRRNYVSFPSEEDAADVGSSEDQVQVKSVRNLRRQTLKEQNAPLEAVDSTKKQVRPTRRTKKFSETLTEDVTDAPVDEEPVDVVTIANSKPKGKKSKKKAKKEHAEVNDKENEVKAAKKKKNKRKKNSQSNSLVEQEESSGRKKNDSNLSMESFHSAAGSPQQEQVSPLQQLGNSSSSKHSDDTETLPIQDANTSKRRSSSKRYSEHNTSTNILVEEVIPTKETEMKLIRASKRRRSSLKVVPDKETVPDITEKKDLNTTFEKEPEEDGSSKKKRKSNTMAENIDPVLLNTSINLDVPVTSNVILNTTFEKDDIETDIKGIKNNKSDNKEVANKNLNLSFEIRRSPRKSVNGSVQTTVLNGTFELSPKPELTKQKSLDSTFDKESKLDSTFDKTSQKTSLGSKSSLITSDDATNSSIVTLDKSNDNSKINITDDDSKTENILNTTPVLIESSMEESRVSVLEHSLKENLTPESQPKATGTPLKREGTFTKDSPSVSPKTPNKRQTLPAAGCTPYHSNRKGSQKKRTLNLTHSIEKPGCRSSLAEVPSRTTRVMFCSPVNNTGVATQRKSKIIKSNLKGSNKSFLFEENDSLSSAGPSRQGRKRSYTQDGEPLASAKRTRLHAERPPPRARTNSAMAKLSNAATPSKPTTPKSEVKATKLPNFAALHARRFERMESLDECQQRKAKRAKQLLVPTGSVAVLERSSPRVTLEPKPRDTPPGPAAPAPASKLPTLSSLQRGYTRFGFKMNCDVNPFSVPPKTDKPKETKPLPRPTVSRPNGIKPVASLKKQVSQPSLAGATSLRRVVAKQTIMREKSFTLAERRNETRKEVRTVIKGVRTNRRFELQMKSRNING